MSEKAIELNDFELFAGKVKNTGATVEGADVVEIGNHYLQTTASKGWDAIWDADEDGEITGQDVVRAGNNYLREYTELTAK